MSLLTRTLLTSLLLSGAITSVAFGSEAIEKIKQAQTELSEIDSKKRDVLGSLYEINMKLKRTNRERGHFEVQRNRTFRSVQELTALVQQLNKQILLKKQKLLARLRAMYKLGDTGILRMIFTADTHRDLDISMRFLKNIIESDYRLIRDYQASLKELDGKKHLLKKQELRLTQLEKKIRIREETLISRQKAKGEILGKIEHDHAMRAEEIKRIRGSLPQDQSLAQLVRPMFFERKGNLPPPIAGAPRQKFGSIEREPGVQLRHPGWSWDTSPSESVRSVYFGTVVFAGEIQGLGKTVVIDHGDHYFSTYASVAQVNVKRGDVVSENQVLGSAALVGSPRIYFEIRHFSEPLDPVNWLSATDRAGPRL